VLVGLTKRAENAGWRLEEAKLAVSELVQNLHGRDVVHVGRRPMVQYFALDLSAAT
jgi:hypothetical protein